MHQLLDALQGGFLVGLSLGCTDMGENTKVMKMSHNHIITALFNHSGAPALITHCDISVAAPVGPVGNWHHPGA